MAMSSCSDTTARGARPAAIPIGRAWRRERVARVAAIALCILLGACGGGGERRVLAERSPAGPVPAEPQRAGDPRAGYRALVNLPYVSCGIPYAAYRQIAKAAAPEQLLPGREGRNATLPYNLTAYTTREGVELVTSNCLTCHAAPFAGRLIVGLGNETLDFTEDRIPYVESVGAYVRAEKEAAEWRRWADRMTAVAPYTTTDTVGVNPAVNLTWALFAHRDPQDLSWSQRPLMTPPPERPLPLSVPPWWRMQKKHAMFYNAAGRGDHARLMILASTLCTDSVEEARAIDGYAPDLRAYLSALAPPVYPYAIDRALAQRGRAAFEASCAGCHGTYGTGGSYPNLVIELDRIGTDPALARAAVGGSEDHFLSWLAHSFYGLRSRLAPAPGYIAPPLDGVWATAPYLHNGSVPTLAALLQSEQRPRYWRRPADLYAYDQDTLGVRYIELKHGKQDAEPTERKWVYDTTLPGYSNLGHRFGDHLADAERRAVIEYLKTL